MMKIVALAMVALLMAACSAGGGAVTVGNKRWQAYWPEQGMDRYEAVVYPADPARP